MWSSSSSANPKPGTIRQVRGATYPPLTAPPGRSGGSSNSLLSRVTSGGSSSNLAVDVSDSSGSTSNSKAPAPPPPQNSAPATPPAAANKKSTTASATPPSAAASTPMSLEVQRLRKFEMLLAAEVVDLKALRAAAWSGVPHQCRAMVWQVLLGYLPPNRAWRESTLERKRQEYYSSVPQYFDVPNAERTDGHRAMLHQILIDVPRTAPSVKIFRQEKVQRALERILYIWALRHPASGYVQGINDLVTPFYFVFLSRHLPRDRPCTEEDVEALSQQELDEVEADAYWCLSKLIDSIQDHYTDSQPGIQRMVFKLSHLVKRIDAPLHQHLENEGLQFIQVRVFESRRPSPLSLSLLLVVPSPDSHPFIALS